MKTDRFYIKILAWAKKIKAIEILGSKCEKCGNSNIFHLTFHHKDKDDKEFRISKIKNYRWSIIEKEIKKCILLCHNCHNELHFCDGINKRNNSNKKLFLEIKNNVGCEICGYNKFNCSLQFHHIGKKSNRFSGFSFEFKSIDNMNNEILDELEECEILCANCHNEIHTDIEFFNKNKTQIYEKSKNIKENKPKLDREIIKTMYFDSKIKQVDIAKYFECSKGTISDIIKKLKQKQIL